VAGSGGLTEQGPGTLTLTGSNSYTGNTSVSGGTLLVNGSTAAGSAAAVSSLGVLGGTGTIGGNVTVNAGGIITGGTLGGVGTLTVGSLSFKGGIYAADFSGNTSDTIAILPGGTVNLNGGAGNFVVNSQAGKATVGTVFTLIDNTGAGPIGNPPLLGAPEGGSATIDGTAGRYTYGGGNGRSFVFSTVPVPPPPVIVAVAANPGPDGVQAFLFQGPGSPRNAVLDFIIADPTFQMHTLVIWWGDAQSPQVIPLGAGAGASYFRALHTYGKRRFGKRYTIRAAVLGGEGPAQTVLGGQVLVWQYFPRGVPRFAGR
jgi:autotransporter-associated beta strand protein